MKKPTHILVIRLSALGDVAMTIPVLRVVAQTYPDIRISVISRASFKALFDEIPKITFLEADVYGKHKGLGILDLAKEGKELGVDAVADLHNVIRSKIIRNYLKVNRIKTMAIDKGRAEKKALTKHEDKVFQPLKTTHQRYADVFADLGLRIDLRTHEFPKRKALSPRLNTLIGTAPKKLIGIAPFAAFRSKMYPFDLMKEVVNQLDASKEYKILLFGGGNQEIAELNKIAEQFNTVTAVAGAMTFEEELALISNLDLMLSMDSGNGHLSALYGVPTVTLWGVTHPYTGFAPFQQKEANSIFSDMEKYPLIPTSVYGNKFPEGYENVMQTIKPEDVVKKVLAII